MVIEWEVSSITRCQIIVVFLLDYISLFFFGTVCLISGAVILYRTSYISRERFFGRFIGIVFLFIFSIFLLIIRPNLLRLLLGWDGLGVTSYLLVIFYQRGKSYGAGIITALTNRMGDVGLLICRGLFISFGGWRFFYYVNSRLSLGRVLTWLLIISACTKSAQIPFSSWLPAAMAAPTPVSALVHSSTLVTAGVFLLVRFNVLVLYFQVSMVLIYVGTLTILMAGFAAIFEIDIKKIIALSTLRQLGVIIIILGGGAPLLAFFHLLSHAFFKAILFMCAGALIHNIKDYQDIRKIRGRLSSMPVTSSIIMVANLSLCGLPFLRGFYSKDLILERLIIGGARPVLLLFIVAGTALTSAYSCRLSFLVSLSLSCSEPINSIRDADHFILAGMGVILPFSILGGEIIYFNLLIEVQIIIISAWIKSLIILSIVFGAWVATQNVIRRGPLGWLKIKTFLATIWFMPVVFRPRARRGGLRYSAGLKTVTERLWVSLFTHIYIITVNIKGTKYFNYIIGNYFTVSLIVFILLLFTVVFS